jgi:calcineurin-like phosphoesterase family protein
METRWNECVGIYDTVYFLGDFAMGPKILIPHVLKRLNGYKILIKGNHDWSDAYMLKSGFDECHNELRVKIDDTELYMRHIPAEDWKGADYHLCGHVHNEWRRKGNCINVGVDVWDLRPQTLKTLLECPDDMK